MRSTCPCLSQGFCFHLGAGGWEDGRVAPRGGRQMSVEPLPIPATSGGSPCAAFLWHFLKSVFQCPIKQIFLFYFVNMLHKLRFSQPRKFSALSFPDFDFSPSCGPTPHSCFPLFNFLSPFHSGKSSTL